MIFRGCWRTARKKVLLIKVGQLNSIFQRLLYFIYYWLTVNSHSNLPISVTTVTVTHMPYLSMCKSSGLVPRWLKPFLSVERLAQSTAGSDVNCKLLTVYKHWLVTRSLYVVKISINHVCMYGWLIHTPTFHNVWWLGATLPVRLGYRITQTAALQWACPVSAIMIQWRTSFQLCT